MKAFTVLISLLIVNPLHLGANAQDISASMKELRLQKQLDQMRREIDTLRQDNIILHQTIQSVHGANVSVREDVEKLRRSHGQLLMDVYELGQKFAKK